MRAKRDTFGNDDNETTKSRSILPWIMVTALSLAMGTAFVLRQVEVMAAGRRLASLRQEIRYYQTINESLAEQIDVLTSDRYIEKTARDKLGLVMPGEVQYMLIVNGPKD